MFCVYVQVARFANASLFFLFYNVFMPSFRQMQLQSLGTENTSLMYSGVFYRKENLLKSTVAFIKIPIGIQIFTGNPFYVITSFKLLFFRNSFILVMLAFPPIERVFNTVKKFEIWRGNSFDNHRELSTVFFSSLAILMA